MELDPPMMEWNWNPSRDEMELDPPELECGWTLPPMIERRILQ